MKLLGFKFLKIIFSYFTDIDSPLSRRRNHFNSHLNNNNHHHHNHHNHPSQHHPGAAPPPPTSGATTAEPSRFPLHNRYAGDDFFNSRHTPVFASYIDPPPPGFIHSQQHPSYFSTRDTTSPPRAGSNPRSTNHTPTPPPQSGAPAPTTFKTQTTIYPEQTTQPPTNNNNPPNSVPIRVDYANNSNTNPRTSDFKCKRLIWIIKTLTF